MVDFVHLLNSFSRQFLAVYQYCRVKLILNLRFQEGIVELAHGVKISKEKLDNANKTKFSLCINNLIDGLFDLIELRDMSWSGRVGKKDQESLSKAEISKLKEKRAVKSDVRISAIKGMTSKNK